MSRANIALGLAIGGYLLANIPFVNIISIPIEILVLIFAIQAIKEKQETTKAKIAIFISIIFLCIGLIGVFVAYQSFSQ